MSKAINRVHELINNVHEFSTQQVPYVKENALAMRHKTDHLPRIFSTIECLMGGAVVILGVNC